MDSEEFVITFPVTLQSTLIFTGFAAKSCQLIVPHNMASPDLSGIQVQIFCSVSCIWTESRIFFMHFKKTLKVLEVLDENLDCGQ